jgi:ligand-binding sensor domain-containing protein/signal transduction histidine kinase
MYHINKVLIVLFIVFLLINKNVSSQHYYFRHYQVEDGLSNSTVFTCLQDKKGFLWMGTKDGLNRFDGYTFKIFRNNPDDSLSIGSNWVRTLSEDKKGTLYVGTNKGLYRYNDTAENFVVINPSGGEVRDIKTDSEGNLWYILNYTLFKYDPQDKKQRQYVLNDHAGATSVCLTKDNNIWISTSEGRLEKYNPVSDSFTAYDVFAKSTHISSKWIEKIYSTSGGSILIGTSNNGVKLFDIVTKDCKDLLRYNSDKTDIYARDFIQSSPDEYWIATESGIFIYNLKNETFTNLKKNYDDPYSISDNAVYTLCRDAEGSIWAGTYFGGLNYYPQKNSVFKKYFPSYSKNALSGNAVREICQDRYGSFWIGTEDAGLNKLDVKSGLFTNYKPTGAKTDVSYYNIHGLLANDNELWIGTFEHGLDVMDVRTGKVVRKYNVQNGKSGLIHNFIVTIYKTRSGEILIGTPAGLQRYNALTDKFSLITEIPQSFIYSILEDSKGNIWASTIGNGVHYFNPVTGEKGNIRNEPGIENSLGSNSVNGLFEDSDHNIWFATEGGGLCQYDVLKKSIRKKYTSKKGFPANYIFKILEDDNKNLWVTTSKGLVKLNPKTGLFRTFTKNNGLLSDQFNYNSAFKSNDGSMYFGCLKGLISFKPSDFTNNTSQAPLFITGLQVNNKDLAIRRKGSPLTKSVIYSKKIVLNHNQSSFNIDFATLSFIAPEMSEYKYKMDGLYDDWIFLKTNRKVYFTDLHPGKYIFRVKGANSDGIWNNEETRLEIDILPPFWASTLAFILYASIFSVAVYYAVYSYHNKTLEKSRRKMEVFEHEKQKQIYQAKIDFFTNVAHEIRTPLTLIKAPLERIVKKAWDNPEIGNNIRIMERNTNKLIELTNQLLDFRRIETDKFRLTFEKINITEALTERFISFRSVAEQENRIFELKVPSRPLYACVDVDGFQKILNNLFTNAIKYSKHQVCISLFPFTDYDENFTIEIKNDGYLIPGEMKERIFEPFFRIKETKKQTGSGIGLALSRSLTELHNGQLYMKEPEDEMNVFILSLPVYQLTEFSAEQKH